ncbi:hypothetical protein [Corynebacterium kozikiae]|uniref:hypothetical protein n=1 Tax=Corynebacterium kozikiae TaxID=2968469 RepID=UPI00211C7A78|nr:hypothetical protein [Corynebacterium sp. 76QC2CO]
MEPLLNELIYAPRVAVGVEGGNAVRRVGSKPPTSIAMLDLKFSVEQLLDWWIYRLKVYEPRRCRRGVVGTSIAERAAGLAALVAQTQSQEIPEQAREASKENRPVGGVE